jgi:outer membrane protein assembly factor BamE
MNTKYTFQLTLLILSLFLSSGCSRGLFSVHTIDIQQGNALETDNIRKIKVGMSKKNVERVLGSPVLIPIFEPNRWDYVYYLKKPDTQPKKQRVSIYFSGDTVNKISR